MLTIVEGMPHGVPFDLDPINAQLKRRQGGYGRGGRMKIESDAAQVLSGTRQGRTLGSPLTLMVPNRDQTMDRLPAVTKVRPAHADLPGVLKTGAHDARDILERASARETCARVLAGEAAATLLRCFNVEAFAWVSRIGEHQLASEASADDLATLRASRDSSEFYALNRAHDEALKAYVDETRRSGDTLGGTIEVAVFGLPPGLGSYTQWDRKLDAKIAAALMSVQAIKSVSIGAGEDYATKPGSKLHDPILLEANSNPNFPASIARPTNNAGGIEGGMSNGEVLRARATMKPIATLMRPLPTIDIETLGEADAARERSDVCAVPAASVVLESAIMVPIAEAMIEKFGGDSLDEMRCNLQSYLGRIESRFAKGANVAEA